jgi:hypothetical protein
MFVFSFVFVFFVLIGHFLYRIAEDACQKAAELLKHESAAGPDKHPDDDTKRVEYWIQVVSPFDISA